MTQATKPNMRSRWAFDETFTGVPFKTLLKTLPEWIIKYGEDAIFDVSGTGEDTDVGIFYESLETEDEMVQRIKQEEKFKANREVHERKLLAELKAKYE